jgi:hypothetical protein
MLMTYAMTQRTLTGQYTAVMRAEMATEQVPAWLPKACQNVYDYLQQARINPTGPPFARSWSPNRRPGTPTSWSLTAYSAPASRRPRGAFRPGATAWSPSPSRP